MTFCKRRSTLIHFGEVNMQRCSYYYSAVRIFIIKKLDSSSNSEGASKGNENVKKAIRLVSKTTTLRVLHTF